MFVGIHSFVGTASSVLALWDHRFLAHPLHLLEGHSGEITCAAWSPSSSSALATGSDDMKVIVWDLAKVILTEYIVLHKNINNDVISFHEFSDNHPF